MATTLKSEFPGGIASAPAATSPNAIAQLPARPLREKKKERYI